MKRSIHESTPKQKLAVLLLFSAIVCYRTFLFLSYPLLPDETCSYLYFVRQGFIATICSYPLPNNHVLYNLGCIILAKCPFLSPILIMRLPSLVGDIVLLWAIFCVSKRLGGFQRAFAIVSGCAFCYFLSFYAVQGRGYQWQDSCFFLALAGGWTWFISPIWKGRFGYSLFVLASVAGFYINPGFIFPYLALIFAFSFMLFWQNDYRQWRRLVLSSILVGLLAMTLYLPLIIASSWKAVFDNEFVSAGKGWHDLVDRLPDLRYSISYIFNLGRFGIWIVGFFLSVCIWFWSTRKITGRYYAFGLFVFVGTLISFALIIIVKRIFPYDRLFCFWVLLLNIIFINVIFDISRRFFPRSTWVWLLSIFLLFKIGISVRLLWLRRDFVENQGGPRTYAFFERDFDRLNTLHPHSWQMTDSDDFYPMYIRFFLVGQNRENEVIVDRNSARSDILFLPDKYDSLAIGQGYVKYGENKLTEKGNSIRIYVRRRFIPDSIQ
ncbi:MAG TPA: hypothetical protein VKR32_16615 [Puia sp.]|nr:hypothetical protein [Puia sp.]